jgi:quinol-cytochrome oxidoreductase complex cytochrome b subunit
MAAVGLVQQLFIVAAVAIVGSSGLATVYVAVVDTRGEGGLTRVLWLLALLPVLPFVILVTYLRGKGSRSAGNVGTRRRVAVIAIIAGLVAIGVGGILGPPDPFSQTRYITGAYPIGVLVGYVITA